MRPLIPFLPCILCCLVRVSANAEKVIFLGPPSSADQVHVAPAASSLPEPLDSPLLQRLSPANLSLRRQLHAAFPHSPPSSEPPEAWILLEALTPGQRYEVRICWSASQPTDFNLSVLEPAAVLSSPDLRASLRRYLDGRTKANTAPESSQSERQGKDSSTLLFYVSAAADYFTDDQRLMSEGQLVTVDIILDPFVLNVFPASLLPTGAYIAVLAVVAWYLSSFVANFLQQLAATDISPPSKKIK